MTTGSYNRDNRRATDGFSDGYYVVLYIGETSTKSWSGADWGPSGPPSVQKRAFSLVQEPSAPVNAGFPRVRGPTGRLPRRAYTVDNPYTMSASKTVHAHVMYRQEPFPYNREAASTSMGAFGAFPNVEWSPNDEIRLRSKLSDKIAGSDFNLGVFLGEGREALNMVASSATRVYQALKSLKRGDVPNMWRSLTGSARGRRYDRFRKDGYLNYDDFELRELRRNQKIAFLDKQSSYDRDLSSIWLEAQYGWKPLLNDIHGAAAYVAERLERSPTRNVRVRSRVSVAFDEYPSQSAFILVTGAKHVISKQVIARISSENPTALTGLMDVASVAWELVPWSFVADWFIPIGSYFKGMSLPGKVNATYVVSTLSTKSFKGMAPAPGSGITLLSGSGLAAQSDVTLTREVLTTLPSIPLPKFKPLSSVPSWVRAGNAVALIDQIRPRKP